MSLGLYLHIPYCLARCRYCDFYSRGGQKEVPDAYVAALLREMERICNCDCTALRPDTLYFGGGTPSLLRPDQAAALIRAAAPVPEGEVTLEANPETVDPAKLEGFRQAGVNRLSLGVQTADDESLARLGRPHTAAQSRQALAWARQAGFANISGDIMLALPRYTREEFDRTLDLLAEGGCTHISAYLLKIEPGTAFARHTPEGLPDPDEAADFCLYGLEQLSAACYRQYEISNFARPGYEGRHNLLYWDCQDYLGLGPAAHSCLNRKRFYWPGDTRAFIEGTARPVEDGGCDGEDYIMLRLRLTQGLDEEELARRFGVRLNERQRAFWRRCQQAGYAQPGEGPLRLTPAGLIIQNSILTELLA